MQLLPIKTIGNVSADQCAADLLASAPLVMRFIRQAMRAHRRARLSMPQFRALVFVGVTDDRSLSAMAEHIGLSLPAASRLVDLLVRRGMMIRRAAATDRRRVELFLTARGRRAFQRARRATQAVLERRFAELSTTQRSLVSRALQVIGRLFGPARSPRDPRVGRSGPTRRK